MEITLKLDQRCLIRKVISCYHFLLVMLAVYILQTRIYIFYSLACKIHASHIMELTWMLFVSFLNHKSLA